MKMMKSLTAITLSAALVPAMALSTSAFAESEDMKADSEQSAVENSSSESSSGQFLSGESTNTIYADDVIGQTVKHRSSNEDIGEIQDLVISDDGRIAGVVLTTGAFLGLGGQEVGLNWDQLERTMEDDEAVFYVDMDEEALRNAPEHERESE